MPCSALKKWWLRNFSLFPPHITFQHILHLPAVKILAQPCRSHYHSKTAARAKVLVLRFPSPPGATISGVQVTKTGVTQQLAADIQALAVGRRYTASAGSQPTAPTTAKQDEGHWIRFGVAFRNTLPLINLMQPWIPLLSKLLNSLLKHTKKNRVRKARFVSRWGSGGVGCESFVPTGLL